MSRLELNDVQKAAGLNSQKRKGNYNRYDETEKFLNMRNYNSLSALEPVQKDPLSSSMKNLMEQQG